jgi:hypothetical protein
MKTLLPFFCLLLLVLSVANATASSLQKKLGGPAPTKFIQISQCEDSNCMRCRQMKVPENFCHHVGIDGETTQSAECAPAPKSRCFQETVYQHSWAGGSSSSSSSSSSNTFSAGNNKNNNKEQDPANQCQPDRIESTQPRQCGVCLQNRIHNHPPSSTSFSGANQWPDNRHNFIIFTNCADDGSMELSTGCDFTCQNCTGHPRKIFYKQCIPDDEFAVSIEYSAPFQCPEVLLVSNYKNFSDRNCSGQPQFVSHTFTDACYTEGLGGHSVKYQCLDPNSKK